MPSRILITGGAGFSGCHVSALLLARGYRVRILDCERYVDTNERGTAVLSQALLEHPVERIVVASSMSVYGEGRLTGYTGSDANLIAPLTGASEPVKPIVMPEPLTVNATFTRTLSLENPSVSA